MKIRNTKKMRDLRQNAVGKRYDDNGTLYVVLEQDPITGETSPCPFCGRIHTHGVGDGRVCGHCPLNHNEIFKNALGQEFTSGDGYITVVKKDPANDRA